MKVKLHKTTLTTVGILLLTSGVLGAAGDGSAAARPDSTHRGNVAVDILYQRFGENRLEVGLVRSDGTEDHALVPAVPGGHQTNPDWAPDGQRFTFIQAEDDGTEDLWVARADGTHPRRLLDCQAPCRYLDDPAWSPRGGLIAYSRTSEVGGRGISTLETVDVRTGQVRSVLGPWVRRFTAGVRWSPDAGRLVFELVHKVNATVDSDIDGVTLTTLRLRDGDLHGLTDPLLYAATADWSHDGQRIVYSALPTAASAQPDLYLISPRGGSPRRVTHLGEAGGYAAEPTWTPDDRAVVFSGSLDGSGLPVLLQVSPDSSSVRSATGDATIAGRHPRVRPVPSS
jgi:Tol biopolymer transport system component